MNEPELFCDGSSGIYIPQRFATEVARDKVTGITDEDYAILERGPDYSFFSNRDTDTGYYWDTWDKVLTNAVITFEGITWYLYQNGDLWIVPEDYEDDDFFGSEL